MSPSSSKNVTIIKEMSPSTGENVTEIVRMSQTGQEKVPELTDEELALPLELFDAQRNRGTTETSVHLLVVS